MEEKDDVLRWQYTLQVVAAGVFTCLFSKWRYEGLGEALKNISYEMVMFFAQLLCLIFFPISIPVIFFVVRKLQRDNLVRRQVLLGKLKPEDFE